MEQNIEKENKEIIKSNEEIKNLIYTIRGKQVMLDSDVANLYHYTTKNINKAMKRNIERFPEDFCFQLNEDEFQNLRFQNGTLNKKVNNGNVTRKYLPYVYTEHGIAMLSGVLKNEIAIQVSIGIMRAFIEMRKFIAENGQILERLTNIEYKQIEDEKSISKLFQMFENKEKVKQKIFFKGQIWDSYSLIIDIIKTAKEKILIIDNYIDDSILAMLSKKNINVVAIILTSKTCNITNLDIKKFNSEYPTLKISKTNIFHDRFIIIDNKELYHCGASLKDLGKKCFAINKIESIELLNSLNKKINIT